MKTEILRRPLLTEKATLHAEKGVYHFEVSPTANKIEIKKAVESRFGVTVTGVRTAWGQGKEKSQFTRKGLLRGSKTAIKKAVVSLKKGDEIDVFAPADAKGGSTGL